MAYVKPGVEVTQTQKTVSPNLITPDLNAVVVGPGYFIGDYDGALYPPYTGGSLQVTVSGLDTSVMALDTTTLYVDLVGRSGSLAGTVKHLVALSQYTVDANTGIVTISGNLTGSYVSDPSAGVITTGVAYSSTVYAVPKIGFRALRTDLNKLVTIESVSDIETQVGKITVKNPLAFGLYMSLLNANTVVYGYGVRSDQTANPALTPNSASDSTEHANALSYLETREVYALAPLTTNSSILSSYRTHVNNSSLPINKHERIAFLNPLIPWTTASDTLVGTTYLVGALDATTDKSGTARMLRTNALTLGERRIFYTFPDTAYVQEEMHVSTLSYTALQGFFGFSGSTNANKLFAVLDQQVTLSSAHPVHPNMIYSPGTQITSTVLTDLSAVTEVSRYQVRIPVPGFYIPTVVAGEVAGEAPQQGFTNLPTAGLSSLKFSSDWFTETQLNLIAEGGNYIMHQPSAVSPIVCRHQLSTNMSSVQTRELNIIKSVDFVAKFVRNGISPYIGRYNVTPQFLALLTTTLNAQATFLIRAGYINDMKILKVEQDPIQLDTILVDLSVLPQYPVNYVKINLIF